MIPSVPWELTPQAARSRNHLVGGPGGSRQQSGDDALRRGRKDAAKAHLPGWGEKLTPHVMRHFCASQLYENGMDLLAIQEVLGHFWITTTMRYVHVQQTRAEDTWAAGTERAAKRLEGLIR
ncbi:tyrosine-type recombinase/integrase [Streptomyces sp. NPDC058459]|uniref:tyrosine-type recombinase/integrase n=1 Tax=Streptomyces sp. NPDC058459 TaxID=3346508 RepID=UPI00364D61B4